MIPNGSIQNQQQSQHIQSNQNIQNIQNIENGGIGIRPFNNNNTAQQIPSQLKNLDNNIDKNGANIINYNNAQNEESQKNKNNGNNNIMSLMSIEYENKLKEDLQLSNPLISELLPINILLKDYENNFEYVTSIKEITSKYKNIRKVIRDGNCFYRSFIYRLFEYICMKNNKNLYEHIKKKITEAKDLIQRNGYDWNFISDFYNIFYTQLYYSFNSLETKGVTVRDYLDTLFKDKEVGNYFIYFIRFCIAAFLKENAFMYEVFVEGPFENWIINEVEAIDHEAEQIQIMACVNYFDIGVKIEYLNPNKNEVMKFPEDKDDKDIFINVLFTPGHYDILYN